MSFDWEFEEDQKDHTPTSSGAGAAGPTGRRMTPRQLWLRRGLVLLVLLVAAGLGLRAWYQQRLQLIQQAETQLRALVALELGTISQGDAELFRSRQDPSDPRWRDRQVARYFGPQADGFVPAPGLVPAERPGRVDSVHLSGRTARVELTRWFTYPAQPSSASGSFRLTWFYRQHPDGSWYHVAPPSGYWGPRQVWDEHPLDIHLTRAEAGALRRTDPSDEANATTGVRLRQVLTRACTWLQCPERDHYMLRFDDVFAPQIEDNTWTLPALTLTGLPADAASRAFWIRALEMWMVEAFARTQIEEEQLTERLIYQQLVARLQQNVLTSSRTGATLPVADRELVARAVRENRNHSLWRLWRAEADPDDPGETRLLQSEVALLLDYFTYQMGVHELLRLLPALDEYASLDRALYDFYRLDADAFENAWVFHLARLALEPLTLPSATGQRPGDHLALTCEGRVWVGNADGNQLAPLTPADEVFVGAQWSPDGRWLLSTWQPAVFTRQRPSIPYLLAPDGQGGRVLSQEEPLASQVAFMGWHPDGQQVVYYSWQPVISQINAAQNTAQFWAADVETGARTALPGLPEWSPNGQHLAYIAIDGDDFPAVWIAQADWKDAWLVAEPAWFQPGLAWSPSGDQLALLDANEDLNHPRAAVYDVSGRQFTSLISSNELVSAFLAYKGPLISDGTDPKLIQDQPPRNVWPLAWSADGRHLLIFASADGGGAAGPALLAAIPGEVTTGAERPQPLPIRVVAYGRQSFFGSATWSPTDPRRLALAGMRPDDRTPLTDNYLFDLDGGVVYSVTLRQSGAIFSLLALEGTEVPAWSPDGRWVAFAGQEGVIIVDREGRQRFNWTPGDSDGCQNVAWNPAADLGRLNGSRETRKMGEIMAPLRPQPSPVLRP